MRVRGRFRGLRLPLAMACALASPLAARAASCPIVDATRDFWPLAQESAGLPAGDQAAQFRARIVAQFPGLYAPDVLGLADPQQFDNRVVAALAAVGTPQARAPAIAQSLSRDLPGLIRRFEQSFPDLRCDFPIYLMISLGQLDGAGRIVDGHPALVLGVDTIAQFEQAEQLPVFASHELFHRYHYQAAGFSDDPGDRQAIWRTLWAEGLATFVSARLNPERPLADALLLPRDLAERAAPLTARLAAELEHNDQEDPALYAKYFLYGSPSAEAAGLPSRAGYYIGYRVAEMAARGCTLPALAHMQGPALHQEIQRDLQVLAGEIADTPGHVAPCAGG
jgi:hypothetical protein